MGVSLFVSRTGASVRGILAPAPSRPMEELNAHNEKSYDTPYS